MPPQVTVFNIAQELRAIRLGMKILPGQGRPRLVHVKKGKQACWGLVGLKSRRLLPDIRQRGLRRFMMIQDGDMRDALPQLPELLRRIGKINQEEARTVRQGRWRHAVTNRHIGRRLAQAAPGSPGGSEAVRTMGVVENIVAHQLLPLHQNIAPASGQYSSSGDRQTSRPEYGSF